MANISRCPWATHHHLDQEYHDNEWGKITTDERLLFEMLCLEGMQAGLNWHMILKKRSSYQQVFHSFSIEKILAMTAGERQLLLVSDLGIIKNKLKIAAIFTNAEAFLTVASAFGTFYEYIWQFVDHQQIINYHVEQNDVPASSELSIIISKDLKKRGFKFIGPITTYSFLQAIGVINDHLISCSFRFLPKDEREQI
ncbi:MAG: DNA-3-methyladenine glycosylase I [Culicoidibacterales bacterium]